MQKQRINSLTSADYVPKGDGKSKSISAILAVGGAALCWLYGESPAFALSGAVITAGQVGFFAPSSTVTPGVNDFGKLYCDWRYDVAVSPNLPACAQHDAGVLAYGIPPIGPTTPIAFFPESDTTISFTSSQSVTTYTKDESTRASLICQTAADGSGRQHCLRIQENPIFQDNTPPSGSCKATFSTVTNNLSECAVDLNYLTATFGPTSRVDWTAHRDPSTPNRTVVNICSNSLVDCAENPMTNMPMPPSEVREAQQIGIATAYTPYTCKINGKLVSWPYPC